MTKQIIIADSGPLIALALIDKLALLKTLYNRVMIPPAVWAEVTVQGVGLPGASAVAKQEGFEIQAPNAVSVRPLSLLVDRGEAEAIALALETPESIVLLDDSQARRVAERLDIQRIGTLGILRKAKRAGWLDEIGPLIETLRSNGIYLRQGLVDAVLRDVGEKIE